MVVDVNFVAGPDLVPGTYTLVNFTSTTMTLGDFTYTGLSGFGGFFTLTSSALKFTVTAPPQLSGTVTLGDFVGPVAGQLVTVEVRSPGTTNVLDTYTTALDSTGHYAVNTTRTGSFDV